MAAVGSDRKPGGGRSRRYRTVPHEGDDGLYTQSWFAVCRSVDLGAGTVLGRPFLGGKVVVVRDLAGRAQVMSAYCPHLGADLALGRVTEHGLRCAFHGWEFDGNGLCARTGIGDPAPPGACLFRFPTTERYGVVWAFNGTEPLFDLAGPSRAVETLAIETAPAMQLGTDPWVICANTPDWSHFATVHQFAFPREGQNESLSFEQYGVRRRFVARLDAGDGAEVTFDVTVRGTTQVVVEGESEGQWFCFMACMGLPRPRTTEFFVATMVDRTAAASDATAQGSLARWIALGGRMGAEDAAIWQTIHFKQGQLTRADTALARYLDALRAYPRAHPSADFID